MSDNVIKLISRSPSGRDRRGQIIYTETAATTLCEVVPLSRDEFFNGAQVGINAEIEFKINPAEYGGQKVVEYQGRRYSVYRSYEASPDELELYTEYVTGLNGGANDDS